MTNSILSLLNDTPLGRWRNTYQQDDIKLKHLKICDSLSMEPGKHLPLEIAASTLSVLSRLDYAVLVFISGLVTSQLCMANKIKI